MGSGGFFSTHPCPVLGERKIFPHPYPISHSVWAIKCISMRCILQIKQGGTSPCVLVYLHRAYSRARQTQDKLWYLIFLNMLLQMLWLLFSFILTVTHATCLFFFFGINKCSALVLWFLDFRLLMQYLHYFLFSRANMMSLRLSFLKRGLHSRRNTRNFMTHCMQRYTFCIHTLIWLFYYRTTLWDELKVNYLYDS